MMERSHVLVTVEQGLTKRGYSCAGHSPYEKPVAARANDYSWVLACCRRRDANLETPRGDVSSPALGMREPPWALGPHGRLRAPTSQDRDHMAPASRDVTWEPFLSTSSTAGDGEKLLWTTTTTTTTVYAGIESPADHHTAPWFVMVSV